MADKGPPTVFEFELVRKADEEAGLPELTLQRLHGGRYDWPNIPAPDGELELRRDGEVVASGDWDTIRETKV
jgi:predicted NAD/FAD-dependent oxidoreductase